MLLVFVGVGTHSHRRKGKIAADGLFEVARVHFWISLRIGQAGFSCTISFQWLVAGVVLLEGVLALSEVDITGQLVSMG